jgi:hypothetical protein
VRQTPLARQFLTRIQQKDGLSGPSFFSADELFLYRNGEVAQKTRSDLLHALLFGVNCPQNLIFLSFLWLKSFPSWAIEPRVVLGGWPGTVGTVWLPNAMGGTMQTWMIGLLGALLALPALSVAAAPRKGHTVVLGAAKRVSYSHAGDPAGAGDAETELKIRALIVDSAVKEWTTGDAHDVTDRSFVVRRAIRINDTLPGEKQGPGDKLDRWVWQRGPWLLVDRVTGRIAPLKLPDYDPAVSQVVWFRDYAAYCGVTVSGKSLYAVVWQVGGRKPVLAKKLDGFDKEHHAETACAPVEWQREPLKTTFHPAGKSAVGFEIVPGSAVLVEDSEEPETPQAPVK